MRPCSLLLALGLALAITPAARAQDLTGHWCGYWEDCRSGHHGPLRADFTKCDETHYRVVFTGRFYKVIPFRFVAVLEVTGHEGDKALLSGDSRVGLSGTFNYSAEATASDFTAQFTSRRYEGRFVLSR